MDGFLPMAAFQSAIQRLEKAFAAIHTFRIAHAPVRMQYQRVLRKREQDVPARMRALRCAFQQAGIALRIRRGEREQVTRAG